MELSTDAIKTAIDECRCQRLSDNPLKREREEAQNVQMAYDATLELTALLAALELKTSEYDDLSIAYKVMKRSLDSARRWAMTWKQAASKDCPIYFAIDAYNKPGLYLKTEEAIAAAKVNGNDIFKKIEKSEAPAKIDWAAENKKQEESRAANLPIVNACAEQLMQRIVSERISMKQAMMAIAETFDSDKRIGERRGKYSLEKMDAVKLIGLCLEALMWQQAGWQNDITDSDFKAFCKRFSIDIDEAKKTAEAAKSAPKEPKKKSA